MGAEIGGRVRERRAGLGLTQGQVAERAGISRAGVGALEQGRHMPAADAAIRLARVLETTVERLFGATAQTPVTATSVLGESLRTGALVRAARVGETLVATAIEPAAALGGLAASADGRVLPAPGRPARGSVAAVPAGTVPVAHVALFDGAAATGAVVMGCDPLLRIADGLLAHAKDARILGVPATTGAALAALDAGRCHAVLVHGPRARLAAALRPRTRRWHFARWRAGVATHPALGGPSLEALLAGGIPFIQRDAGAACQQAVERAARRLGPAPSRGHDGVARPSTDPAGSRSVGPGSAGTPAGSTPAGGLRAAGHLEAARTALEQRGAAVTIEPVALAVGLDFAALELHDVELWAPEAHAAHPGVVALLDLLVTTRLRERIVALPAYDLTDAGSAR